MKVCLDLQIAGFLSDFVRIHSSLVDSRHVTQTLPQVTDLFGQFLNICCIFSGETAKDF